MYWEISHCRPFEIEHTRGSKTAFKPIKDKKCHPGNITRNNVSATRSLSVVFTLIIVKLPPNKTAYRVKKNVNVHTSITS